MFQKLSNFIKNFFVEVGKDLKKIKITSILSNTKWLILLILSLIAIAIVCVNLNFFSVLKGIFFGLILYFIFLWRK